MQLSVTMLQHVLTTHMMPGSQPQYMGAGGYRWKKEGAEEPLACKDLGQNRQRARVEGKRDGPLVWRPARPPKAPFY